MMQLTCGRCGTQWNVVGSTAPPCPRCGAMAPTSPSQPPPGTARSPLAATTERTAFGFTDPASQAAAAAHTLPAPTPAMLAPNAGHAAIPSYPPPPQHAIATAPSYPAAYPIAQPPAYIPPSAQVPSGAGHMPSYPAASAPPSMQVVAHPAATPYMTPPPDALAPYGRKKDAGIAALLSFFIPGAGQLYNGQMGKGAAFLMVMIFVNLPLMFVWIGFLTGFVTWLWSIIDAYVSAGRINRAQKV